MVFGIAMDESGCFSADYADARTAIGDGAMAAGGSHRSYNNPNKGPSGEDLATDAFWFGPLDAKSVLVMVSATHGVEGFCGSAAQLDWLKFAGPGTLGADQAVLLVHAINPHGFAWLRRVTEEGVDLNRNGIDFAKGLPDNPGYDELADAFVPTSLDAKVLEDGKGRLAIYRRTHGEIAFETARSCGQYNHPEGIFYGGTGPTWSLRTLQSIVRDFHLDERRHIALIDYHTGLGPFGYGEPICGHRPGTIGQQRCREWYGESLGEPLLGKSSSLPIDGLSQYAWQRAIGDALTFIALEFGTYPMDVGAAALRDDHWLHAYGTVEWGTEETNSIKTRLRKFYHPDTSDWRQMVLVRSRQVISQALEGMAGA